MTQIEALKLALEALENSVDLVRQDAYNAEELYGNYPARQGKVCGLKVLAEDHEKAITAIKAALEAKDEPVGTAGELFTNTALERLDLRPSTGIYITPLPVAEPYKHKPLTDEDIERLWPMRPTDDVINFARAIEAAHGIKGEA